MPALVVATLALRRLSGASFAPLTLAPPLLALAGPSLAWRRLSPSLAPLFALRGPSLASLILRRLTSRGFALARPPAGPAALPFTGPGRSLALLTLPGLAPLGFALAGLPAGPAARPALAALPLLSTLAVLSRRSAALPRAPALPLTSPGRSLALLTLPGLTSLRFTLGELLRTRPDGAVAESNPDGFGRHGPALRAKRQCRDNGKKMSHCRSSLSLARPYRQLGDPSRVPNVHKTWAFLHRETAQDDAARRMVLACAAR